MSEEKKRWADVTTLDMHESRAVNANVPIDIQKRVNGMAVDSGAIPIIGQLTTLYQRSWVFWYSTRASEAVIAMHMGAKEILLSATQSSSNTQKRRATSLSMHLASQQPMTLPMMPMFARWDSRVHANTNCTNKTRFPDVADTADVGIDGDF